VAVRDRSHAARDPWWDERMTTWIDPSFDEAIARADLIAVADVHAATPAGVEARLVRVLAGDEPAGASVAIRRAAVVGHGHADDTLPLERFLFIAVRAGAAAGYAAISDTYWWFRFSDPERVHLPIRDPFTRVHIVVDDLAQLIALLRDRARSPLAFLTRQVDELIATPVAATQPIEVNTQVIALEALALLGAAEHAPRAVPFLGSPHYQVRWSAVRALGRCWGDVARGALVDHLAREDAPPSQTAIAEALLGRATAADRPAIERALPHMHDEPVRLARSIMSPVFNTLPAPRKVLSAVLARIAS
jgi:HEAT repeats